MKPKITPLFDWLTSRAAGVLVHPTSFPGNQGIGVLNQASADSLFGFLNDAGISQQYI